MTDMRIDIDIDKAEEILRADGMEIVRSGLRSIGGWVPADEQRPGLLHAVFVTDRARAVIGGVQRFSERESRLTHARGFLMMVLPRPRGGAEGAP